MTVILWNCARYLYSVFIVGINHLRTKKFFKIIDSFHSMHNWFQFCLFRHSYILMYIIIYVNINTRLRFNVKIYIRCTVGYEYIILSVHHTIIWKISIYMIYCFIYLTVGTLSIQHVLHSVISTKKKKVYKVSVLILGILYYYNNMQIYVGHRSCG